jgi:hypothetical protein
MGFKSRKANFPIRQIVNPETLHIISSLVFHQGYDPAGRLHPLTEADAVEDYWCAPVDRGVPENDT